ncbi:MAG TPA: RNA polymerase sigma-70 factor [Bacteroidetes bacterium]|nr:RNA polymerase sigma-70 factor [Bacteroidota bacterium]
MHPENLQFERIRQGDVREYEKVFRTYYQALCNYACTFLKDPDEAEETVQQVFVTIWNKREQISINTTLQAYLYRAVNNASLNRIRHQKVRNEHRDQVMAMESPVVEHTAQQVISKELTREIRKAVEALPDKCREAFEMSRYEGLSYAEIAEQQGVSVKAIEKQMGKALRLLRVALADYLPLILLYLSEGFRS